MCSRLEQTISTKLAALVNVEPTMPRVCSKQTLRGSIPIDNAMTYYRVHLSIPFMDHILEEFHTVKIEQMRTKYDEYSSFKLCVPTYLKNKVLDKNFWGNNDIYVRNFVQKTRY